MKKLVFCMLTMLFFVGCKGDVKNTKQPSDNNLNSTVLNESKEKSVIEFKETSNLGRGSYIEVKKMVKVGPNHSQYERLKGKPVLITIGWIAKSKDGMYRYYEPETNELNPTFIEKDLDVLKDKIRSHYSK
jgi:hypothetical protein